MYIFHGKQEGSLGTLMLSKAGCEEGLLTKKNSFSVTGTLEDDSTKNCNSSFEIYK